MAWMNLEPAHRQAKEEFALREPGSMAFNAAVTYRPETAEFIVPFLGSHYLVKYPGGEVIDAAGGPEVPKEVQITLLHYLAKASPAQVEGRLISFQELPGGFIYVGPFNNRAVRPLVGIFGGKPELLVRAAEMLGGRRVEIGDVAVSVPVLPKVPITFVLWLGDEEFPPSGNVLFDASASRHLPTEDYALLPGLVLGKMRRLV
ncbi:DUF3786 domain-containing protein [Desulfofundulus sp. TPOSR]|uniref:DUF3786 domain-containing protein n=2 Tax=Peptococcaceae TaxID=186807 RepID=A0AAU8PPC6_DESK7|nr:hypothetical protein Desku_1217 [Desulfofundulus kuznetsovii DSM 6115]NHM25734.1 DUF3786 domain-containing protein [Desulfofundulus sp. TPOSR]